MLVIARDISCGSDGVIAGKLRLRQPSGEVITTSSNPSVSFSVVTSTLGSSAAIFSVDCTEMTLVERYIVAFAIAL